MPKHISFLLSLAVYFLGWGQELSNVKFKHWYAYDCTKTIKLKDLRGGCNQIETLDFESKGNLLVLTKFEITEQFFSFDGDGFSENRIKDSVKVIRKSKASFYEFRFKQYISELISQEKGTVSFSFRTAIKGIEIENFIKTNNINRANLDKIQKIRLQESFDTYVYSTVQNRIELSFNLKGICYSLTKTMENPYWTITSSDSTEKIKIINTDFDNFLCDYLPDNFSGKGAICNYMNIEYLVEWIALKIK